MPVNTITFNPRARTRVLLGLTPIHVPTPASLEYKVVVEPVFEREEDIAPVFSRVVENSVHLISRGTLFATSSKVTISRDGRGRTTVRLWKKYTTVESKVVRLKTPGGMTVKMRRPTAKAFMHGKGQQGGGYAFCGVGRKRRS